MLDCLKLCCLLSGIFEPAPHMSPLTRPMCIRPVSNGPFSRSILEVDMASPDDASANGHEATRSRRGNRRIGKGAPTGARDAEQIRILEMVEGHIRDPSAERRDVRPRIHLHPGVELDLKREEFTASAADKLKSYVDDLITPEPNASVEELRATALALGGFGGVAAIPSSASSNVAGNSGLRAAQAGIDPGWTESPPDRPVPSSPP